MWLVRLPFGMSDVVDDLEFWGRQVLRKSWSKPLRIRKREFVEAQSPDVEPKDWRRWIGGGTELSDLVDEGSAERLKAPVAPYFFDTSALVNRYNEEPGTEHVDRGVSTDDGERRTAPVEWLPPSHGLLVPSE